MILLYHLVFPDSTPPNAWNAGLVLRLKDFKRQLLWMKSFYRMVSLDEYVDQIQGKGKLNERLAALTFDDCYSRTLDLVSPFLLDKGIPATFFANTLHLEQDSLLWFVHFNALCFEKVYPELLIDNIRYPLSTQEECHKAWRTLIGNAKASEDARTYSQCISSAYPLPPEIVSKYRGLSKEQLRQIGTSPILNVGGHTHSHPYLVQLSSDQQFTEIIYNKELLERYSGKAVNHFAYTGGEYNSESILAVKKAGFKSGLAVRPKKITSDLVYELPRTDIYGASLVKFWVKISGLNYA